MDTSDKKLVRSEGNPNDGGWTNFYSWRKSYTLRVRYLTFDPKIQAAVPDSIYVRGQGYVRPNSLDDVKLNTISKIANVVKVDVPVQLP